MSMSDRTQHIEDDMLEVEGRLHGLLGLRK
jgi:hypothetical protein